MKSAPLLLFLCAALAPAAVCAGNAAAGEHAGAAAAAPNTLTAAERAAGWTLLFDGTAAGAAANWRTVRKDVFPQNGWKVADGTLSILAKPKGTKGAWGGDIVSRKTYANFELSADFRITAGANSGIKYFIQTNAGKETAVGPEFQVLDDVRHPDAKKGKGGNRTVGSLYDLIAAPADKPAVKPGEWHTARIVARGTKVEHWLDGVKVVAYDRRSPEFRELVAGSKYKKFANFAAWERGHILLQDHSDTVAYRNLKIREFK